MKDSSVILEIPPATTIAYGVIELFIKHSGQFGKYKGHFLWYTVQQSYLLGNDFYISLWLKVMMLFGFHCIDSYLCCEMLLSKLVMPFHLFG